MMRTGANMLTSTRRQTANIALALLLLLAITATAQASNQALRKSRTAKVSLLYVVNAHGASLTRRPNGQLMLTLTGVAPDAVWFSDRPVRESGTFPASGLASAWEAFGFAAQPPNAALDYTDPRRGPGHTVILELTHPRYGGGRLSFAVRIIDPRTMASGNLASHARRADRTPPRTLLDPSLFIDDFAFPENVFLYQPLTVNGCTIVTFAHCPGVSLAGLTFNRPMPFWDADFEGANFTGATLDMWGLFNADLIGANFTRADLNNTFLIGANLTGADLRGANLTDTSFVGATLTNANLTSATGANLSGAYLCNTTGPTGQMLNTSCR
jgi:Pentapeptide repeats (8 copies)